LTDAFEQFARFAMEHARLYSPVSSDSEVELVPVAPNRNQSARNAKKRRRRKGSGATRARLDRGQVSGDRREPSKIGGDPDPASIQKLSSASQLMHTLPAGHELGPDEQPGPRIESAVLARGAGPQGKPRIAFEPHELTLNLPVFNDQHFHLHAPKAQEVSLVWQESGSDIVQRVHMEQSSLGEFEAVVAMDDADYLVTYEVDAAGRPDPRYATRVVVKNGCAFAPMRISRKELVLALHNYATWDEVVCLEADSPWLVTQGEVVIPAHGLAETIARILPERMGQGKNNTGLTAFVRRGQKVVVAASASLEINLEAGGAIPEMRCEPNGFGWIVQGQDVLEFDVEIRARGHGQLRGMVYLGHTGEATDFQVEASGDPSLFLKRYTVDSLDLPHRSEGILKVTLVSDSYLSNNRVIEARLPYQLVYLKKSLPALAFGRIKQGLARTLRLEVDRSDGQPVDLEATVRESARHYLQAFRARPNAYSFMFDARDLQVGYTIKEVVALVDRGSGLRDQVKVLAEVIGGQAQTA
jgi:hypothetical protein